MRNKGEGRLSRRELLVGGAAALAAGGSAACLPGVDGSWSQTACTYKTPVVTPGDPARAGQVLELADATLSSGGKINATATAAGLRKLLLALSGKPDIKGAWAALIPTLQANQVVGIKVNVLNERVPTSPVVVKALVDLLKEGGLTASQILIWDRRLDELTKAGFTDETMGATVEGTWDTATEKGVGRGYEYSATCIGGRNTHLSNIMTRRVDHLINLAVMKRHGLSGFTGVLKNHYGTIDNPGDFHDQINAAKVVLEKRFDQAIPGINALDEVHRKTRLWLLDSVIGVCKGDTESPADCAPNRLLAALDPVALDVRGRQVRDEARGSAGKDPEVISEDWLHNAEKIGLGKMAITTQKVT